MIAYDFFFVFEFVVESTVPFGSAADVHRLEQRACQPLKTDFQACFSIFCQRIPKTLRPLFRGRNRPAESDPISEQLWCSRTRRFSATEEIRFLSLFTTDSGVFSPTSIRPLTGGGSTTNSIPTTPPEDPSGYTYTMNHGNAPTRIVFQNPATGLQFDDSAPSSFTYTYFPSGTLAYHLVLTFRPGKWDEYDLTFTNGGAGSLVVRRYDNNRLKQTDGGTFSVVRTNP